VREPRAERRRGEGQYTGVDVHGDASFADFLVIFSVTKRFE